MDDMAISRRELIDVLRAWAGPEESAEDFMSELDSAIMDDELAAGERAFDSLSREGQVRVAREEEARAYEEGRYTDMGLPATAAWAIRRLLGARYCGKVIPLDARYYWDGRYYRADSLNVNEETRRVILGDGSDMPWDTILHLYEPTEESEDRRRGIGA